MKTKRILFSVFIFTLVLLSLSTPVDDVIAQFIVNSNFDNGSIGTYNFNDSEMEFTVNSDGLSYEYWTNFKVSGVLGEEVTFRITNADKVPFLSDTEYESQMVYSCDDGENWNRLTDHSYDSGTYVFTQTFTCDEAQIATFFPYSYGKMNNFVNTAKSSQWATDVYLGSSRQGRDIDLLTITNDAISVTDKKIIYIIGRQHAAETASSHMLEGMIEFLISNDIHAKCFRDSYVWQIVPMVNPDGVYVGNSRADFEGNDPNRDWDNNDTVEINMVRNSLESINNEYGIDMFVDWHSQMDDDSWFNYVYSPPGNGFFDILSKWTDFDDQYAVGTSCRRDSCTARGYATLRLGLFTFVFEPTPHLTSWTEESLKQQGKYTAFSIDEYFGMCRFVYLPLMYHP